MYGGDDEESRQELRQRHNMQILKSSGIMAGSGSWDGLQWFSFLGHQAAS